MTVPSVFYARSPLASRQFFCPHHCRGQPMASISTVKVPSSPCGPVAKASLLNDVQHPPEDMEEWAEPRLAGQFLALSSGSESELSAIRFSTYSLREDVNEWTPRSRRASLRRTDHRRNRSAPVTVPSMETDATFSYQKTRGPMDLQRMCNPWPRAFSITHCARSARRRAAHCAVGGLVPIGANQCRLTPVRANPRSMSIRPNSRQIRYAFFFAAICLRTTPTMSASTSVATISMSV